jgi:FAD/FMN-containing dehydrogenase
MKPGFLVDLQRHLLGVVSSAPEAIEHYSSDQGMIRQEPLAVVYPQNTADVRKTVLFAAERTLTGKALNITPRGKGSNHGGNATGPGLTLALTAHMNKLIRLDQATVTVQPGMSAVALQQLLYSHGKHIPQLPVGNYSATIGGLVASNMIGEKSFKYGPLDRAVKTLKVVLADGSLILTERITARELNRRKGYATLEGELYRKLDSLLLDNPQLIKQHAIGSVAGGNGYNLADVKGPKGSFDLTPIFIGSEGTLGIITEISLAIQTFNPRTSLAVGFFHDRAQAGEAITRLRSLEPCIIELIDRHALEFHENHSPGDLEGLMPIPTPTLVVFTEFDNSSQFTQKLRMNRAEHIMQRHGAKIRQSRDPVEQVALWKILLSPVSTWLSSGNKPALPVIDSAIVPVSKLPILIDRASKLLEKHNQLPALWADAGLGLLHVWPRFDLAKKKDIEALFLLSQEYLELVHSLGGTMAANGSVALDAKLMAKFVGEDYFNLLSQTKSIFDPNGIFSPFQKTSASTEYFKAHLNTRRVVPGLEDDLVPSN